MSKQRNQHGERTQGKFPAESAPEANLKTKNIAEHKNAAPLSKPRYFERPDQDQSPLTLFETVMIVLSTHLGVRTRQKRQEDFRRANGFYLFIAGVVYFSLLIVGLIILVRHLTR